MARAYYSTVLEHTADDVWAVIRPFDHYAWAGVPGDVTIEAGKAGDQISAIRRVPAGEKILRQVLRAHSDAERFYSYAFCDAAPYPVLDYEATIRVTPVVQTGQAFVEWWATFDCAIDERARWVAFFEHEGFAKWLSALRRYMAERSKISQPVG
jgi:hypothetical protein